MTRRPGTSLMEVLITLGILGIGLTSVITLFPLAAITTGQALKDDRTAACALSADGYLRDYHHRYVVEGGAPNEFYPTAMDGGGTTGLPPIPPTSTEPSYPVAIDPMGWFARQGRPDQSRLGEAPNTTNVPRVNLSAITTNQMALRLCSQMDGFSYNQDGVPQTGFEMREVRYNWMWVLQQPSHRDRFTCTMSVVVFDKRAHLYAPPGSEAVYTGITFNPTLTSVTNVPNTAAIRKGSWVFDVSYDVSGTNRIRHMKGYRVVSVTEVGNTYALELHTPIRRVDGLTAQYNGTLLVMPGVCDVFERPLLTASAVP